MIRTGPDLKGFAQWVRRLLKTMKSERGWGITRVAQESGVPRSTITRWRNEEWDKGIPTRQVVTRLCDGLKVRKDEPFACMGWTLDSRESVREARGQEILEESDLVRRVRLIDVRLGQNPPAEERRRLERAKIAIRHLLDMTEVDEERRQA